MKRGISILLAVCSCFMMTTAMTGCKHKHEAEDWVVTVQPTCTAEGKRVKYCEDCSELFESEVLEKTQHKEPEDWRIVKEATCTEEGERVKCCLDCDALLTSEAIEMIPHEIVGGWKVTQAGSCSAPGKKEKLCTCGLSMDEDSIPVDPYNHVNVKWEITTPATCSATGLKDEHCMDCGKILQTDVEVPQDSNLHAFDVLTNHCSLCGQQELPEITSFNQAEMSGTKLLIMLDYALTGAATLTLDAGTEYVRFVGTPYKEYPLTIKITSRQTPITLDFVNTTIYGNGGVTIGAASKTAIHIGFYGERSAIRGANGAQGDDYMPFRTGKGGYCAISVPGDVYLTIGASSCAINGGNGGRGGHGSIGNDGGNGGNGAMAIYTESSIKATCKEGYSRNNFSIAGGSGGAGGNAGGWFFYSPKAGASGSSAAATNVDIYYY